MSTSQNSFETRAERFNLGNALVNSWLDYSPSNPLIKKINLTAFIGSVESANTLVNNTKALLDAARSSRLPLVFINKDTNPACLEARIRNIVNYLKGDLGLNHSATKAVRSTLLKMKPKYAKKDPEAPRGAGKSPMERSFASAVGLGQDVIDRIATLGASYTPADPNLTIANMQALVDQIQTANTLVVQASEPYGNANRARKTLYDQNDGMKERIQSIKGYLASFPGGKKSNHYIEYVQAIKGV